MVPSVDVLVVRVFHDESIRTHEAPELGAVESRAVVVQPHRDIAGLLLLACEQLVGLRDASGSVRTVRNVVLR